MIIIETCPKCGHDLHDVMLASFPPIPKKECWSCGWSWIGEPVQVMRVPFGGNSIIDDLVENNYFETETYDFTLLNDNLSKYSLVDNFTQSACVNCPNSPKNGGSGNCNCTLGQIHIT